MATAGIKRTLTITLRDNSKMEYEMKPINEIVNCNRSKKVSVLSAPGITYTGYFIGITHVEGEDNIQLKSLFGTHGVSIPVADAAGWFYTDEHRMIRPVDADHN